ncbi:DUF6059 family protein [Streptomyces sp. SID13726]|uniref:DUF6059 family protein n=1 Tax=Streptomyces sp. SID13726 TaxID=2706058 RepID=UPI0013B812F3|nr:DUF6059 family protein [Streptomyces sp. SID13726]NEB05901.1 hypothetical protein [Streptomyces sp. SID13726]
MYRLWWWLKGRVVAPAVRALAALGSIHVGIPHRDPCPDLWPDQRPGLRSAPPPGHPERLRPDLTPTALERHLEADLARGRWLTRRRHSRGLSHNHSHSRARSRGRGPGGQAPGGQAPPARPLG